MLLPFKKSEPLDRAVRRICRQHLGLALTCLRQSKHSVAAHAVRKEIQKLRAILRLVRGQISPDLYRLTVKPLRQAAKLLAAPRDAQVMLVTFRKLAGPAADRKFPQIDRALHKYRRQELCRFRDDDGVAAAKMILKKVNRRVALLEFAGEGWPALAPGLRQSYAGAQQDYEAVRIKSSTKNLHAWRKKAKIFRDQLRLLAPKPQLAADPLLSGLMQITDLLGDDHDLSVLAEFIADQSGGQGTPQTQLRKLIALRQNGLRAAAVQLGARLFAEKPAAVCAQLERQWHHWQGPMVSR